VAAAITVSAWIALVLLSMRHGAAAMSRAVMTSQAPHATQHAMAGGQAGWPPWSAMWIAMWVAMSVAMMLPLAAPGLEPILRRTYRRWRIAVGAAYLASYVALWVIAGLVARSLQVAVVDVVPPVVWTCIWLTVGAAVAWSPTRRALLTRCHRRLAQPPQGFDAVLVAARSSCRLWQRCVLLCGPAMLAMVPMRAGMWVVMAAGAGASWWEQRRPRAWRDPVPIGLLAAAALAVVVLDVMGGLT
jgi:hypothetical protein